MAQKSDKEFADDIHLMIHAIRMIDKYKPSAMEVKIGKMVIEKYSDTCKECRERGEQLKNQPKDKSFFSKLGEVINND